AALGSAGLAHRALGGTVGLFVWPMQALPIAGALLSYCFVMTASTEVFVPFISKCPVNRSWLKTVRNQSPFYFVGAGVAAALAELVAHRQWTALPAVAIPLFFAYRAYLDYTRSLDDERRRAEVIESLEQGMAVVDGNGRVALWNDALQRLTGCSRELALGRSVLEAVPAVSKTALPRVITEVLSERNPQTLS